MLVELMNPGNRVVVNQATSMIRMIWSATGIHSLNLTILRHLFLSRASRRSFLYARLAESARVVTTRP